MRGLRLTLAVLLVTTGWAGCVGTSTDALEQQSVDEALSQQQLGVPEDATIQETSEGLRVVLENVELPLEQDIQIPNGTEKVRVTAKRAGSGPVLPLLTNAETDGFRCWPALRQAWNSFVDDTTSCSGLTAIDGESPTWTVRVLTTPNVNFLTAVTGVSALEETETAEAERVQIDLIEEVDGGLAGKVDLSKLSEPHHEVGETTTHTVESHDGTELFVEVTTPQGGHEAYPTLLISSPYTTDDRAANERPYDSTIQDYVKRGYAVVVADVRGFARSDGCVNVWGEAEQGDQRVLVEWITEQDFSDGNVGMYGVSYPGTTPVEAAVQNPEGLEAIVSTAGVLNAYRDWHFGGVPNGESIGSPFFYQQLGTQTTSPDPLEAAMDSANGYCDPALTARANDPRAIYDGYYVDRNFTQRADQVEAAVMVEHAYEDPNVKSSMQMGWFNDLDTDKLGLFGHWSHQPAARADEISLRLAWMDEFVKDKDLGLEGVSTASISANGDRYREAPEWPDPSVDDQRLWPHFDSAEMVGKPSSGSDAMTLTGASALEPAGDLTGAVETDTAIVLETRLLQDFALAGAGQITLDATLEGADNAYVAAYLYDAGGDEPKLVTFGWTNLAHRGSHDSYDPWAPGERDQVPLPLLPTEYTFEANDTMQLVLRGVTEDSWSRYKPSQPARLVLSGGEDGTVIDLPRLPAGAYDSVPDSVATDPPS